jgi:hypothetical protein
VLEDPSEVARNIYLWSTEVSGAAGVTWRTPYI